MSKIVVGRGRNQVTIGPELEAMVNRVLNESAPEIKRRLEQAITEIRVAAEARWPVRPTAAERHAARKAARAKRAKPTPEQEAKWRANRKARDKGDKTTARGPRPAQTEVPDNRPHSRDLMEQGIRIVDANTIEAFLMNPAPYVYFIKSRQNGLDGKSPFQELMRKPAIAAGEKLAEALGHVLGEIAGGRNG